MTLQMLSVDGGAMINIDHIVSVKAHTKGTPHITTISMINGREFTWTGDPFELRTLVNQGTNVFHVVGAKGE